MKNVRLNDVTDAALRLRTVGAERGPQARLDQSRRHCDVTDSVGTVCTAYTAALLWIWVGFPICYGIGWWLSQ